MIAYAKEDIDTAIPLLAESYQIASDLEDANGIAQVGINLGYLLKQTGQTQQAILIITASRDAFLLLGNREKVALLNDWLQQLPS